MLVQGRFLNSFHNGSRSTIAAFVLQVICNGAITQLRVADDCAGNSGNLLESSGASWPAKRPPRLSFLALAACMSALAFPVVSASDDLIALRPEAEESSSINSCVKKSKTTLSPTWGNDAPPISEAVRVYSVKPNLEPIQRISESPNVFLEQASARIMGCRAPPCPESLSSDCAGGDRALSQLRPVLLLSRITGSRAAATVACKCKTNGPMERQMQNTSLESGRHLYPVPRDLEKKES